MDRYNDFMLMQAEKPELSNLMRGHTHEHDDEQEATPKNVSAYVHLLIAYGIIEEAFLLYTKRWIDEETWEQWAVWLKDLARHPRFDIIHKRMRGQFDKRFEEHVSKILEETQP